MKLFANISRFKRTGAALLALRSALLIAQSASALPSSSKVGFITTPIVGSGGTLPTTNAAFSGFTFTNVPIATLDALANLNTACKNAASDANPSVACDTLVLNVNSSGAAFRCNTNNITATQKTTLNSFVSNGGKLIIYDSECPAQNYSWLQYPFTTNNPGAQGARGTLTIVEENNLSTTNPADQFFINANLIATGTDAVGDMNVMVTLDSNWCLDMSGTNVTPVTGPVHTYARFNNGLFIYNGMDTDVLGAGTVPNSGSGATGSTNFAKVWLQELQAPFNPSPLSALPCGSVVTGINISPMTAVNDLNAGQTSHQVTARLADQLNVPKPNVLVTFSVEPGSVNAGASGACTANADCTTDANGNVSFTYSSNGSEGTDKIKACFTPVAGQPPVCSQLADKQWVKGGNQLCDVDNDGDIDKIDLSLISRARGQTPSVGDPRDANLDGKIDPRDVKVCIPQCTRAQCATQ